MTAAAPGDILVIPGRLIINPTDLALANAPNFGGVEIGSASEIIWRRNQRQHPIIAEEHGGEEVDRLRVGQSPQLSMFLRGFDKDALAKVYQDVVVSTKTGQPQIDYPPASAGVGTFASDLSVRLLYLADDREHVQSLLLFNAYPLIEEAADIDFSSQDTKEYGTPVIWYATRDSSQRVYEERLLEDMTQTLP